MRYYEASSRIASSPEAVWAVADGRGGLAILGLRCRPGRRPDRAR